MTPERASAALVLRVNEVFHDMEGAAYGNVHPEIFESERRRWERLLDAYVAGHAGAFRCVDLGCGTAFVSELLLRRLRGGDSLVCADVSDTMLGICGGKFSGNGGGVALETLKLRDETIGLPDASADVVAMNSVLHHVPDARRLLEEIARVLKPGGVLLIGHEPNARFWRSAAMRFQYRAAHALVPKRLAANVLKALGLYGSAVKSKADPFLDELNGRLLAEGTIATPLTRTDLSRLIDVHSPTAGGFRFDEGFDPYSLLAGLPRDGLRVETYNHLSKMSDAPFLRPYAWLLGKLLPRTGATFFLAARKRSAA